MDSKTFRGENMLAVLQKVQEELGPEAIVLSTRTVPGGSPWQVWREPEIEVIAGLPKANIAPAREKPSQPSGSEESPPQQASIPSGGPTARQASHWQPQHLTRAEAAARQENTGQAVVGTVHSASSPAGKPPEAEGRPAPIARQPERPNPRPESVIPEGMRTLQRLLLDQEIEAGWVDRNLRLAAETLPVGLARDGEVCRSFLRRQMEADLPIQRAEPAGQSKNVICLVGSRGSGKTSMLGRLALHHARAGTRKIRWVCADTVRASAVAEASMYTQALNLPMSLVYTPADWPAVLQDSADLILVDTPGVNPWDERQIAGLGELLTSLPTRSLYLVASAATKLKDALQSAVVLSVFGLRGLCVTHLDETRTYGNVFDLARKSQIPLAFFASNCEVTDSLEQARPGRLVDALFGRGWS